MMALGPTPGDEITLINVDPSLPKAQRGKTSGKPSRALRSASSKFVPVFVAVGGKYLTLTTRSRATHVLVHVAYDNSDWYGQTVFKFGEDAVRCYSQRLGDVRTYYVDLATNVDTLPAPVRQAISAAYSQVDNYDFTLGNKARMIRRILKTEKSNSVPKNISIVPEMFVRAAVSGEHHTHLRPEEIYAVVKKDPQREKLFMTLVDKLLAVKGVTEAFASSALLYVSLASITVATMFANSSYLWTTDLDTIMDRLKEVSVAFKALHSAGLLDLTELFELNTLVNRGYGQVSWKQEREHRLNPDTINVSPEDVYIKARKVFDMGTQHGFKYKKMSLDDFIDSRWEWSPPGSVHSQHKQDEKYINRESYRHRTKFVTLNSMPKTHIQGMFRRQPQIRAWASTKYEWGKERAIYGVDLTSATVAHFAMFNCEESLKHRFPVGEDAEAGRVHKRLTQMLEGCDSYCYDFDDFNAQHSTSSMVAVVKAYRDAYATAMSEEQLAAMNWILDSYTDILIYPQDGDPYRPQGTLLSGSRLTTFINTVLNFVYMDIAGVFTHSGVADSVHNGDDVLIAIRSVKAAIDVHDCMSEINARAQATKCNILSVGEFLRVEHKIEMSDGMGAQYLSRACATAVHSRIESQAPVRAVEAVSATCTRMSELRRRAPASTEIINSLQQQIFKHLSHVFSVPYDKLCLVADSHVVVGGCSNERWAPVEFKIREEVPHTPIDLEGEETVESAVRPGCYDYSNRLYNRLNGVIPLNSIHKSVSRATRAQLAITRETHLYIDDVSAQIKYKYARALKGMYKNIVKLPFITRARFLGVPPLALASQAQISKLLKLTASVSDVMWSLKVLL